MRINKAISKTALISSLALSSGCGAPAIRQAIVSGPGDQDNLRPGNYAIMIRKEPKGLLQAPFGYFNPGLGLRGSLSLSGGHLADPHPAYRAIKSLAGSYSNKYMGYEGVPAEFVVDNPGYFTAAQTGLEAYVDLGQFRLGNEFTKKEASVMQLKHLWNNWDTTGTLQLDFLLESRNIFLAGVNLLSSRVGGEPDEVLAPYEPIKYQETPVYVALGLNYGLDYYRYRTEAWAQAAGAVTARDNLGSGTGWGHRIFLDLTANGLASSPRQAELMWPLSLRIGVDFGQLKESAWSSSFYVITTQLAVGLQYNFLPRAEKTLECESDPMTKGGTKCLVK
jgi:hypothetical protein